MGWAQRHKGELWVLVVTALLCALVLESALRFHGYVPGLHTLDPRFAKVDNLKMLRGLAADGNGIQSIPDDVLTEIWEMSAKDSFLLSENCFAGVYQVAEQSILLRKGKTPGELYDAHARAMAVPPSERDAWQQALVGFADSAANRDGFRSIAFRPMVTARPKVLLLGDSFTFGHSASSVHRSFADLLLARGYMVYNSGITATDAAQYLAMAEKWIPLLKPDVVITNFYMGNDIAYFERVPEPGQELFYVTNAGFLMACPEGVVLRSAEEAYAVCMYWCGIAPDAPPLARMMSYTASTSALYGVLWRNGIAYHETDFIKSYNRRKQEVQLPYPYSRLQLLKIDSIARLHGARSIVSVIPSVTETGFLVAEDMPEAFIGIDYIQIPVSNEDFLPEDGHFNDHGHRRYADFLQKLIDEE